MGCALLTGSLAFTVPATWEQLAALAVVIVVGCSGAGEGRSLCQAAVVGDAVSTGVVG